MTSNVPISPKTPRVKTVYSIYLSSRLVFNFPFECLGGFPISIMNRSLVYSSCYGVVVVVVV